MAEAMPAAAAPLVSLRGTGSGVDAAAADNAGRRDGRDAGALRPLVATQGSAARADGSARVRAGLTDVVAAVYGPLDAPVPRQRHDAADVFVSLRGAPAASEDAVARSVRRAVLEAVLLRLHPRRAVAVGVHVVCDDGAVVAAAVNAVFLALVDAGVEMRSMLTAACIAVKDRAVVVDPEGVEEAEADAVVTFTYDAATGKPDDLVAVFSSGDCNGHDMFMLAAKTARDVCKSTRAFLKLAIAGKADDASSPAASSHEHKS